VNDPDPRTLARARGGDLGAFEDLVRQYQGDVWRFAYHFTRDRSLADDVTQEAFLRAWRSLDRFDLERPFGPWVCRIAANLAVNHVRSPRAREEGLPEGHAETRSSGPGPLGALLDAEGARVLEAAMGQLPQEQRAVLVLRVVEDLSYAEIAETLGISPGTVMSRLFRARERLAQSLSPYLGAAAQRRKAGAS